ncbi:hypothetical protein [Vibrio europaeus]|uniref:hypothetical protein n=1 Tax=Vibrio europaeus TaxID=300876 RepID=UPI0039E0FC65
MNRIREGFLLTRNPFNASQVKRVSLEPQDVELTTSTGSKDEPVYFEYRLVFALIRS